MNIKEATSVKKINDKYGIAIFEDEKCNKWGPTVQFVITNKDKDGDWYQATPSWYVADLIKNGVREYDNPDGAGIYIDFGANWFVPAAPYAEAQKAMIQYMNGERFDDKYEGKIW